MDTETVRLNITLPKGLVQAMNRVTGPRKRSRFIAEAVRQKIAQNEKRRGGKAVSTRLPGRCERKPRIDERIRERRFRGLG